MRNRYVMFFVLYVLFSVCLLHYFSIMRVTLLLWVLAMFMDHLNSGSSCGLLFYYLYYYGGYEYIYSKKQILVHPYIISLHEMNDP